MVRSTDVPYTLPIQKYMEMDMIMLNNWYGMAELVYKVKLTFLTFAVTFVYSLQNGQHTHPVSSTPLPGKLL